MQPGGSISGAHVGAHVRRVYMCVACSQQSSRVLLHLGFRVYNFCFVCVLPFPLNHLLQ
jgi:hypothetical protein